MNDWMVVGVEPYRRLSGTMTTLWVWQRPCLKCSQPLQVKTPEGVVRSSTFEKVKRCPSCRDPGAVAWGRKGAAAAKAAKTQAIADSRGNTQRNAHCNAQRIACNVQHGMQHDATLQTGEASACNTAGGGVLAHPPAALHDAGGVALALREPANFCAQLFAHSLEART